MIDQDLFSGFGIDDFIKKPADTENTNQKLRCHTEKSKLKFDKRRFISEKNLLDEVDWHFKNGYNYHIMSHGDVDSLSFLKHILRQQPLNYLLISTWCIGIEDVEELKTWVEKRLIRRFDCYLGEISKASYANVQSDLERLTESTGGRCGVFRNHSKVMLCYGDLFQCTILSSANVNSNPRCENTTIFCDEELTDWYKNFFDEINPFNGSPDGWTKWDKVK